MARNIQATLAAACAATALTITAITGATGVALATAAPAEAAGRTFYGSHPPAKSWICAVFGICSTGRWCNDGNKAATKPSEIRPCKWVTVRY